MVHNPSQQKIDAVTFDDLVKEYKTPLTLMTLVGSPASVFDIDEVREFFKSKPDLMVKAAKLYIGRQEAHAKAGLKERARQSQLAKINARQKAADEAAKAKAEEEEKDAQEVEDKPKRRGRPSKKSAS